MSNTSCCSLWLTEDIQFPQSTKQNSNKNHDDRYLTCNEEKGNDNLGEISYLQQLSDRVGL